MSMFGVQAGGESPLGLANPLFKLEYPQSIGVFGSYAEAQKAVDALADQNFPVANLAIVGTDLKLVERVTGRKTWGTVIQQGMMSGLSTALMIAMILFLFDPTRDFFGLLIEALLIGLVIGVGFAALGHRMSGGRRDFTSVSQTIPGKFEILCEHKVAVQARDLLARTPGAGSAALAPQPYAAQPYPPQPYAPGYGAYPPAGFPPPQQPPPQQQPQPGQPPQNAQFTHGQVPPAAYPEPVTYPPAPGYGPPVPQQPPYGQGPYGAAYPPPYGAQTPAGPDAAAQPEPQTFDPTGAGEANPRRPDAREGGTAD